MLNFQTATVPQLIEEVTIIENEIGDFYSALSPAQRAWKPAPTEWSIGQCLTHIVRSNEGYFVDFAAVAAGTKRHTFWERIPFLPKIVGPQLIAGLTPGRGLPIPAPPAFVPPEAEPAPDLLDQFRAQQRRLVGFLSTTHALPLDQIMVTSPAASFVAYSMIDAYRIMIVHERLHQAQMESVAAAQRLAPA